MNVAFHTVEGSPNFSDSRDLWRAVSQYLKSRDPTDRKKLYALQQSILSKMGKDRKVIAARQKELEYKIQLLTSDSKTVASKQEWLRFLGSFHCEQMGWWRAGVISLKELLELSYYSEYDLFHKMSPFKAYLIFYTVNRGEDLSAVIPQLYFNFLRTASKQKVKVEKQKPYAFLVLKRDMRKCHIMAL